METILILFHPTSCEDPYIYEEHDEIFIYAHLNCLYNIIILGKG